MTHTHTRALEALQDELEDLLRRCAALEQFLSDVVQLMWETASLKADMRREQGRLERDQRDATAAAKRLAGQLRRQEEREAARLQAQRRAEAQAQKERARAEALAESVRARDQARMARRAVKTGVLPGHGDPEGRRLCVEALVKARKQEQERVRRARAFMEELGARIFSTRQPPAFAFHHYRAYHTEQLVRFYMIERIGTAGFWIQFAPRPRLFRLTCRIDAAQGALFSSPLVDLEDIVAWLDQQAFADACADMFGYETDDPLLDAHAGEIYDLFTSICDDAVFEALRLREADTVDCYGLPTFELTAAEPDGTPRLLRCSMVQLVLWFAMGKIQALAQGTIQ